MMVSIEAPISQVTCLEDRAYIVRRASPSLEAGTVRLSLGPLTPILADKTVALEATSADGSLALVLDLKVVREWSPQDNQVTTNVSTLKEAERAKARELQQLTLKIADLAGLLGHLPEEIMENAAWDRGDLELWTENWDLLETDQSALVQRQQDLRIEHQALRRELELAREVQAKQQAWARVEVLLELAQEGPVELTLQYAVPCATWRPSHRFIYHQGNSTFVSEATVWQNSGEDWNQVELFLSTARARRTTTIPKLYSDPLHTKEKATETVLTSREQEARSLGEISVQLTQVVPGIDDGGESIHLKAKAPFTLSSHGQSTRAKLFEFSTESRFRRLARPELLAQVLLESTQHHTGHHRLLAGPVELVSESSLVGTTWLDFVAPGQEFSLCWGPDPTISLKRSQEAKTEASGFLKGWVATHYKVEIFLSNLSEETRSLQITERVPVSESEAAEVEFHQTSSYLGKVPDENGFVQWDVELEPGQRKKMNLQYALKIKKSASMV